MTKEREALRVALKNLLMATKHLGACPATVQAAEEALAQPDLVTKEVSLPEQHYLNMVAVSLMREGVDKHRAREYAQHFFKMAQPEQPEQEPAARVAEVHMSRYTLEWTNGPLPEGTKLYTSPLKREWVGLTDDERAACWSSSAKQSAINIEAQTE